MDPLTLFDVEKEVMCPGLGASRDGLRPAQPPHPTTADNFSKNQSYCKDCQKKRDMYRSHRNRPGYKKAKYNPETGEKWCYKIGDFGLHWEDPDNFGYDAQWDDNKHHNCLDCTAAYWQARKEEDRRSNPEYNRWVKDVYARDSYACVLCGSADNIHAHHLNGYNWYEEGRYDVDNGVTLCAMHHRDFHEDHGKGYNTVEQWIEYVEWYQDLTNGEKCGIVLDMDEKRDNKWLTTDDTTRSTGRMVIINTDEEGEETEVVLDLEEEDEEITSDVKENEGV